MNCNQCRFKEPEEESDVCQHFYCHWHHDWIPNRFNNGHEDCPGFYRLEGLNDDGHE